MSQRGDTVVSPVYRGRIAPSPTGLLHLGHARTFWIAQERARAASGRLILRIDDLDRARCRPEFTEALFEDLRWFGLGWDEGPDKPRNRVSYFESERLDLYRRAFEQLRDRGAVFPCVCSRRDIQSALSAPHLSDEEPVYPGHCRPGIGREGGTSAGQSNKPAAWRFQVPDGKAIRFIDHYCGPQEFVAGRDLGDFVVWRAEGLPSYQLACVVDDAEMQITEVVRGRDLLASTARQLLLYQALGWNAPEFFHCPLVTDESGQRLAKRHDALSLRTLRERGVDPASLREDWTRLDLKA